MLAHFLKRKSNRTVFEVTLEILSKTGSRPEVKITLWNNTSHVTTFHFVATQIRDDSCQIRINFLLLSFFIVIIDFIKGSEMIIKWIMMR